MGSSWSGEAEQPEYANLLTCRRGPLSPDVRRALQVSSVDSPPRRRIERSEPIGVHLSGSQAHECGVRQGDICSPLVQYLREILAKEDSVKAAFLPVLLASRREETGDIDRGAFAVAVARIRKHFDPNEPGVSGPVHGPPYSEEEALATFIGSLRSLCQRLELAATRETALSITPADPSGSSSPSTARPMVAEVSTSGLLRSPKGTHESMASRVSPRLEERVLSQLGAPPPLAFKPRPEASPISARNYSRFGTPPLHRKAEGQSDVVQRSHEGGVRQSTPILYRAGSTRQLLQQSTSARNLAINCLGGPSSADEETDLVSRYLATRQTVVTEARIGSSSTPPPIFGVPRGAPPVKADSLEGPRINLRQLGVGSPRVGMQAQVPRKANNQVPPDASKEELLRLLESSRSRVAGFSRALEKEELLLQQQAAEIKQLELLQRELSEAPSVSHPQGCSWMTSIAAPLDGPLGLEDVKWHLESANVLRQRLRELELALDQKEDYVVQLTHELRATWEEHQRPCSLKT